MTAFEISTNAVEALFTRADGAYVFARWGRPIAPVVFGVEEETLSVIKGAVEALCQVSGHAMVETDPELGANLMLFFATDWDQFLEVPNLDHLVPDLEDLIARLKAQEANQYRIFRFDETGAIKACFVFLRMDEHLSAVPAETLALSQVSQSMLLWSDMAFRQMSPLAHIGDERVILRPEISTLLRAAYDPVMPPAAQDPSHALRLHARMSKLS
ncbi:MAG: hypothetical protein AAGD04_09425 [Pseudomonadota bacterium]